MSLGESDKSIWSDCVTHISPTVLCGDVFRVVESQEKVATNELVDTLEEQALLEDMLEVTKPIIPAEAINLSYLLFTPFRYPPLKYGSRFGRRFEPSLFYASRTLTTALAEVAYYRLLFWFDMSEPPPANKLKTLHTAFSVQIETGHGLKLQDKPFSKYEDQLRDKTSYQYSQALGAVLRENKIIAFEYYSVRDKDKGLNVALFNAEALSEDKPASVTNIFCSTQNSGVEFMDDESVVYHYPIDDFLDEGKFPRIN